MKHTDNPRDRGVTHFVPEGGRVAFEAPFLNKDQDDNFGEMHGKWMIDFYEDYVVQAAANQTCQLNPMDLWYYTTKDLKKGDVIYAPLTKQSWVHR